MPLAAILLYFTINNPSIMRFPVGYALSFQYNLIDVPFSVQGEPDGELCITCSHPIFTQRFSGGTKCFHPFISASFTPDETDEHYGFFVNMKMEILNAHSRFKI